MDSKSNFWITIILIFAIQFGFFFNENCIKIQIHVKRQHIISFTEWFLKQKKNLFKSQNKKIILQYLTKDKRELIICY